MCKAHKKTGFFILKRGDSSYTFHVKGRMLWTLERLISAGDHGCCAIDNPAPRWSAYIHRLRNFGLEIETRMEPHSGAFPGTHARYILRDRVERMEHVA